MIAVGFVATGLHAASLGLAAALAAACVAMTLVALAFNRVVLRPLVGRPLIAMIMVTIGFGALLRGASTLTMGGFPRRMTLPLPAEPLALGGVVVATEKLVAAIVAAVVIVVVTAGFRWSRTGVALRAIADDPQTAMSMGIDLDRHVALAWATAGVIAVIGGTLWTVVVGGGLGLVLVGLKVFPIVVIGGLDSIEGTIVGAVLIGIVESLSAGYLDPVLGTGFSSIAPYLLLLGMLLARPYGLFGRADVVRV